MPNGVGATMSETEPSRDGYQIRMETRGDLIVDGRTSRSFPRYLKSSAMTSHGHSRSRKARALSVHTR